MSIDLRRLLSGENVVVPHRIESVKIFPPLSEGSTTEMNTYAGAVACALPETVAPDRKRVFSMSLASTLESDGQPTLWSSALDALSVGGVIEVNDDGVQLVDAPDITDHRLMMIAAGNVDRDERCTDPLQRSDLRSIFNPGQAWNPVTVGAHTELTQLNEADGSFNGYSALAPAGGLSPHSRTSVLFGSQWPLKPDIVMEGGNRVISASGNLVADPFSLGVATTSHNLTAAAFAVAFASSAATAQAARLAALILAQYPELRPETMRAIVIQSARWTPEMFRCCTHDGKLDKKQLVRRFGHGVPDEEVALRSASNALTLVNESLIHPYAKAAMNEVHFHDLPWPVEALRSLGDAFVELDVTLSYFITPNPRRRGWKGRYRYASHGLRFEVKQAAEMFESFQKRLNKLALDEDEAKPSVAGAHEGWTLGPQIRDKGSVHSDTWRGRASDLADRAVIGVYPVTGWWKEVPSRDRSELGAPYSLVVSIRTESESVDIWTPVAQQIDVAIPIEVE